MTDFKTQLQKVYDADAKRRADPKSRMGEWKSEMRTEFAKILQAENKKTILELGAGAGHDSKYFLENGFEVLATDFSPGMVKLCQSQKLNTLELDLYDINILEQNFDAIYALNVLLHIPKKDLGQILESISTRLKSRGVFFCGLYSQDKDQEITIVDPNKMNMPRFFSFLSDSSLLEIFEKYFDIIQFKKITKELNEGYHFQALFMRKKS